MKHTKKLLALVLALMMAVSCMAMPAMAAGEDEGIMPLYAVTQCPQCNGAVRDGAATVTKSKMTVTECDLKPYRHMHYVYLEETPYYCTSAGCSYKGTYSESFMGSCV